MKEIQVTLYEFFGYAAPGAILFVGLYLMAWGVMLDADQNWSPLTSGGWIVLLMLSYVLGHSVQAVCNIVGRRISSLADTEIYSQIEATYPQVVQAARIKACLILGINGNVHLDITSVFDIADHFLQQKGKTESRDIYIYREGFYRGVAIALSVLTAGALVRCINAPGILFAFGVSIPVDRPSLLMVAVIATLMALLSVMRYQRFATYRIKNSLYGFVVLPEKTEDKGKY